MWAIVFQSIACRSILCAALAGAAFTGNVVDDPYSAWQPQRVPAGAHLPTNVAQALSADELARLVDAEPRLPYATPIVGLRAADGTLWVATAEALLRLDPSQTTAAASPAGGAAAAPTASDAADDSESDADSTAEHATRSTPRWHVLHPGRWYPRGAVEALSLDAEGTLWVQSSGGMGRLAQQSQSLESKMAEVGAALRRWHVREGLVGEINLREPGNIEAGYEQPSSDNDGLWTSLYVAAEAFHFAATGDEQARKNAWQSLEALMFLERVTGISGFAARSIVPRADDPKRYGGEWHPSADDRWWWKGDTSSDELDGHYLAYAVYYDLAATPEERAQIRPYVERITDHLLDHGLYYCGPTGKPTTWGVFAPEKLNHDLDWILDRGLNSLEILSHLKVAEHICGHERYTKKLEELDRVHAYPLNTVEQKIVWPVTEVNHSDDELAFCVYYPLLVYEREPRLRRIYEASLRRSWQIERPERSPLFNYIYAAGIQARDWPHPDQRPPEPFIRPRRYDHAQCVAWFRDVPADTLCWTIRNSERRDLGPLVRNRFDQARSLVVLPVSERRVMKWNGDPYELDGGNDAVQRDDGTFILLPYWMGRYHRFLE